jgi:ubiquinone/menaquinone biosynthesis C-methylase UbiE
MWGYKFQKIYESIPIESSPILDIGVGFGRNLNLLLSRFRQSDVIGIDPDFDTIFTTLSLIRDWRTHLVVAVAENLPFRDSIFALVSSWATMHHLAKKYEVIVSIQKVLKSDGTIIIADWNEAGQYFTPHSGDELKHSMNETFKNARRILNIISENINNEYYIIIARK